jgi:hypothetical protein
MLSSVEQTAIDRKTRVDNLFGGIMIVSPLVYGSALFVMTPCTCAQLSQGIIHGD